MNATAAGPSHGSISPAWYSKNPRRSGPIGYFAPQACGISISIAWWISRPPRVSSSSTLSRLALSLPKSSRIGSSFSTSRPNASDFSLGSRAAIALRLPRRVLISPLCASIRNGCASGQDGNVFVEYRWWITATALTMRASVRSG